MQKIMLSAALAAGNIFFLSTTAMAAATPIVSPDVIRANVQRRIIYNNTTQLATSIVSDFRYTGVGGLSVLGAGGQVLGTCTGSLISPTLVLTAAHCFAEVPGTPTGANFFLPSFAGAGGSTFRREVIAASAVTLHPGYNFDVGLIGGSDLALVRLSQASRNTREIYGLYGGSQELNNTSFRMVGTGTIGIGATGTYEPAIGEPNNFDGRKRDGANVYETVWNSFTGCSGGFDALGAPCDSILVYDMDNGTATNDALGRLLGINNTGLRRFGQTADANSSPGDSGGPIFIDGLLAGVVSFGFSSDLLLDQPCAVPGAIDPSADSQGRCTDASFGELSGDTRVSFFRNWITSNFGFGLGPASSFGPGSTGSFGWQGRHFAMFDPLQTPAPGAALLSLFGLAALAGVRRAQRAAMV